VTIKEIVRRTGYIRDLARKVLRGYCPDGGAHRSEVVLKPFLRTMGREPFRIPGGPPRRNWPSSSSEAALVSHSEVSMVGAQRLEPWTR
jgi:hypothetical protein